MWRIKARNCVHTVKNHGSAWTCLAIAIGSPVMSSPVENAAVVALLREGRRPWPVYAELVEETGSALRVLEQELEPDQSPDALFELDAPAAKVDISAQVDGAAAELSAWARDGIQLVSVLDEDYPDNLRAVYDHPPLLFVAGELKPEDARSVSVVGSRNPTESGVASARALATELVAAGYTVTSGLAAGIDTAAHTAALDAGGRTMAVVGTGLYHCYPPQNAELARRIADDCALVSQFWPEAPPTRRTFPMRNGVMSGMTLGTVIVEATHTSGTRVQARLALAQGRPVFLYSALLQQPWARELAQRPGVHVIERSRELTELLDRLTGAGELVADGLAAGAPRN
jgi:DNA processing protein